MTPQLRQAIRLLQLSAAELETEIAEAVETNPLLDWTESSIAVDVDAARADGSDEGVHAGNGHDTETLAPAEADWGPGDGETWYERTGPADADDDMPGAEQVAEGETLQDHLLWQLHLSPLSPRDRLIAVTLIEAVEDDGYLREPLEDIADTLGADFHAQQDEILTVLHQVQRFDPAGVAARTLGECLRLQLAVLPDSTPGKTLAHTLANGPLERLPKVGAAGIAAELKLDLGDVETAVHLLRSLDPKPGLQVGGINNDTYVAPDVVIWRQHGLWRVTLAESLRPRISIHRGYEGMIRQLIDAENPRKPLSDARLAETLKATGVPVARRTVAKYREAMSIPSSQDRVRM